MKITAAQYAKALYEVVKSKNQPESDRIVANFAKTLAKNNQLKLAPKIIEKFKALYNQENGIVEAEVVSAKVLSNELNNKISNYLKSKYGAKEVDFNSVIDRKIKGGVLVKIGDELVDASVATQLENLKNNLSK